MELIRELLPTARRIGFLSNMANPNVQFQMKELERAARTLGFEARVLDARDADSLNRALEAARAQGVDALLTTVEAVVSANRGAIVEFAAKHKLPAIYSSREFVQDGGLISYGVNYPDLYYRAASYIAKILKGTKPGDLPIEQPTKLELVINLKTANALGISVPQELLLRADEVIR
jgi:putative ABC transport system substrate-binding protein